MAMNALRQHPLLFAAIALALVLGGVGIRSEEHTSELQSSQISYAVFCLKKKKKRGSPSLLTDRTAVTVSVTRGKPVANLSTVTERARVSSVAFQYVQPVPELTWSTGRYRPASRVPGSDVYVLIGCHPC